MLLEKLKKFNIYLASQSPRRQELLKKMGINFNIASLIEVDESYHSALKGAEIALFISEKKSDSYASILKQNRLLITSDTIVWVDHKVLGKPKNSNEAKKMLALLSGKKHEVFTGITIRTVNKISSFFEKTEVWFNELSYSEIEYYINKYKPFDKAGSYAIQEWIGHIAIEKINGSYSNVVGLPTEKLYTELKKFID